MWPSEPPSDVSAALAWFDAEHPALISAQQLAAGHHDWHLAVWQLAWTMHTFQLQRGFRHDLPGVWRTGDDFGRRDRGSIAA
ncbi:MAG: hypothetical protein ACJ72N_05550 [Labedaea sp.]